MLAMKCSDGTQVAHAVKAGVSWRQHYAKGQGKPGTKPVASICSVLPSLITFALGARAEVKALIAASALASSR